MMADTVTRHIIVKANVDQAYQVWSNFENFPQFMRYIKSVTRTDSSNSHWVMEGPLGRLVEGDAETTRLEPNQRIAWNSKQNSALKTSGQVTFMPLGDQETDITVSLHYDPPAGWTCDLVTDLFGDPEGKLFADLQNLKAFIEGMPERVHHAK
jgi:uncharacterized membrane protein